MGDKSAIEWTDSTWNPIRARHMATGKVGWACTKVSSGCTHCYAERLNRIRGTGEAYTAKGNELVELFLDERTLTQTLRWRKSRRIFVASMTDLFEERVPDKWIVRIFAVMGVAGCPGHQGRAEEPQTFQILTKRADRMSRLLQSENFQRAVYRAMADLPVQFRPRAFASGYYKAQWPFHNVHLGVSAETQEYADARIPWLLETPTAVRFVSVEPMLGAVDLKRYLLPQSLKGLWADPPLDLPEHKSLSWVIVGGESGGPPERALVDWWALAATSSGSVHAEGNYFIKPEALAWVRQIRDQCMAAVVPFFFKQWGGPRPTSGGRLLDGREWNEMPEVLR